MSKKLIKNCLIIVFLLFISICSDICYNYYKTDSKDQIGFRTLFVQPRILDDIWIMEDSKQVLNREKITTVTQNDIEDILKVKHVQEATNDLKQLENSRDNYGIPSIKVVV